MVRKCRFDNPLLTEMDHTGQACHHLTAGISYKKSSTSNYKKYEFSETIHPIYVFDKFLANKIYWIDHWYLIDDINVSVCQEPVAHEPLCCQDDQQQVESVAEAVDGIVVLDLKFNDSLRAFNS